MCPFIQHHAKNCSNSSMIDYLFIDFIISLRKTYREYNSTDERRSWKGNQAIHSSGSSLSSWIYLGTMGTCKKVGYSKWIFFDVWCDFTYFICYGYLFWALTWTVEHFCKLVFFSDDLHRSFIDMTKRRDEYQSVNAAYRK